MFMLFRNPSTSLPQNSKIVKNHVKTNIALIHQQSYSHFDTEFYFFWVANQTSISIYTVTFHLAFRLHTKESV